MPFSGDVFGSSLLVNLQSNFCRLEWQDVDEIMLVPYLGEQIVVGRDVLNASQFGALSNTSDGMAADGTSTGLPIPTDTLLSVYACTNVPGFPFMLAASEVGPTQVGSDWYLGTDPVGLSARWVGQVYMLSGNFTDTPAARLVWNQYNRVPKALYVNPGYIDDDARTTYVLNAASYAAVHGGTEDSVQFIIGNGLADGPHTGDLVQLGIVVVSGADATAPAQFGIGIDSATDCTIGAGLADSDKANRTVAFTHNFQFQGAAALVTAHLVGMTNGVALTIAADQARDGASVDVPATRLTGLCWC